MKLTKLRKHFECIRQQKKGDCLIQYLEKLKYELRGKNKSLAQEVINGYLISYNGWWSKYYGLESEIKKIYPQDGTKRLKECRERKIKNGGWVDVEIVSGVRE